MSNIEKLIQDLNSENESTRSYAVMDLGHLNDEKAVQPLIDILDREKSIIIRESVFKALAQINGLKCIHALIKLLRSEEAFIRNQAITVLNEKGTDALEPLRTLLKDHDKDVRKLALDALFSFEHPESAKIIVEGFSDPAINVRITAVEYIGRLEAREYVEEVHNVLLSSENILLTCACMETLSVIGNEKTLEIIQTEFSDPDLLDPLIQFSFAKALGNLGNYHSLDLLTNVLDKFGAIICKEVIQSVQKITSRYKIQKLPENLFYSFSKLFGEMDEMSEYAVLNLLSCFKNEITYPLLLEKLSSDNRMVRLGAVEGLGKYGNEQAIPFLEKMMEQYPDDEELVEVINDSIEILKQ
jgi:HEAT repeat protein